MNDYKIGKDIGSLSARVKFLEDKNAHHPCDSSTTERPKGKAGYSTITDDNLFESLREASPNEEVFAILKCLVTTAGDITIRDLFAATTEDVGTAAAEAIAQAKTIGFLKLSNDKCCHQVEDPFEDDYCKRKAGKWCGLVKKTTKKMCTLASDKC